MSVWQRLGGPRSAPVHSEDCQGQGQGVFSTKMRVDLLLDLLQGHAARFRMQSELRALEADAIAEGVKPSVQATCRHHVPGMPSSSTYRALPVSGCRSRCALSWLSLLCRVVGLCLGLAVWGAKQDQQRTDNQLHL